MRSRLTWPRAGSSRSMLIDGVQTIDYGGFVDLVTQHARTVAWL